MDDLKFSTGHRIRYLRKKRNVRIPTILKELNISRSALTGWETGKRFPQGDALKDLAVILNTTTDYLTGRSDREDAPNEKEIADILNSATLTFEGTPITEEKAEALKTVIKAMLTK